MYPQSPLLSPLTTVGDYLELEYPMPVGHGDLFDRALGPEVLRQSNGKLNKKYWMVSSEGFNVYLYEGTPTGWINKTLLFEEREVLKDINLTFDQQGRPIVFYEISGKKLKLYWYNPVESATVISLLGDGYSPACGFDMLSDAGNADSDAMLFFLEDKNTIVMLLQRDRWGVKYRYTVHVDVTRIVSCGMRKDYRFQVIYESFDWEKMKNKGWQAEDKTEGQWVSEV